MVISYSRKYLASSKSSFSYSSVYESVSSNTLEFLLLSFHGLKYYKEICNYKIFLTAFDNIKYAMESSLCTHIPSAYKHKNLKCYDWIVISFFPQDFCLIQYTVFSWISSYSVLFFFYCSLCAPMPNLLHNFQTYSEYIIIFLLNTLLTTCSQAFTNLLSQHVPEVRACCRTHSTDKQRDTVQSFTHLNSQFEMEGTSVLED